MKPFKKKQGSTHSIMALNQRRAVTDLAATLAAQGDTAAAGLVERLAPLLEEGEEMPDVKLLFRLLGRHAKRAGEELEEADTGRWTAGMTLSALRLQCRQEKAALYAAAVKVRKTLVELYGSKLPLPVRPGGAHAARCDGPRRGGTAAGVAAHPSRAEAAAVVSADGEGGPGGLGGGAAAGSYAAREVAGGDGAAADRGGRRGDRPR